MMKIVHKVLAVLFTVMFLVFAFFQFNDEDAWLWVSIYGVAALVSVLVFFGKLYQPLLVSLVLLSVAGSIYFFPETYQGVALEEGMKTSNIKAARESFGLLIIAGVMLYYFLTARLARR